MKKILLLSLATLISCSEANPYLDKIKAKVKEDALGVEMNYESISFQWKDTLTIGKQITKVAAQYDDGLNSILDISYFSEDLLTKESLIRLRNFENRVRNKPKGYKNYEKFAFSNREASSFISNYCDQLEETDRLLSNWDNLGKGNLNVIKNALWYYEREDEYNSRSRGDWNLVKNMVKELEELHSKKEALLERDSNEIIEYKALNVYNINNPMLNGAEVEVEKHFIFDKDLNIIRTED
ncbi:hypothetical protein N9786_00760 [Flavobacteriaceae bacterium]|nr:hypothetical protein [Flavobacteriaceae bacterium]